MRPPTLSEVTPNRRFGPSYPAVFAGGFLSPINDEHEAAISPPTLRDQSALAL
jgi:hypothetical protein